jgi:hypothetical protein
MNRFLFEDADDFKITTTCHRYETAQMSAQCKVASIAFVISGSLFDPFVSIRVIRG